MHQWRPTVTGVEVYFLTVRSWRGFQCQKKTLVVSVLCVHVACCKIYLCFTKTTTQLTMEGVRGRPPCEKHDKHASRFYLEKFWYLFQSWALDVHVSVCKWFSLVYLQTAAGSLSSLPPDSTDKNSNFTTQLIRHENHFVSSFHCANNLQLCCLTT